jgi:hypothetical protein
MALATLVFFDYFRKGKKTFFACFFGRGKKRASLSMPSLEKLADVLRWTLTRKDSRFFLLSKKNAKRKNCRELRKVN